MNTVVTQSGCTLNGQPVPCSQFTHALGWIFGLGFLGIVIFVLCVIFWIWMLAHALRNPVKDKWVWVIIILLTNLIGAIIYYFSVKRHFQSPGMPIPTSANTP